MKYIIKFAVASLVGNLLLGTRGDDQPVAIIKHFSVLVFGCLT